MAKAKGIVKPNAPPEEHRELRFSFKHLDRSDKEFQVEQCAPEFFEALVTQLQRYARFTVDDFRDQNNSDRRHIINFNDTSKKFPESIDADGDISEEAWQFCLRPGVEKPPDGAWRVHGFLLDDVFYIVWLDPYHRLFPKLQTSRPC